MLTTEDKEDIRRIIAETLLARPAESSNEDDRRADEIEQLKRLVQMVAKVVGETRVVEIETEVKPIVEVTARAMEVFGTREKALSWLNSPVLSLGDQTPLSLLKTPDGVAQVQDILGRVEHGVW